MVTVVNSKEFIESCLDGGYVPCFKIKYLKQWIKQNPKDCYTDEDFINVYRCFDSDMYTDGEWGTVLDVYK